jgi:hypothetical protein
MREWRICETWMRRVRVRERRRGGDLIARLPHSSVHDTFPTKFRCVAAAAERGGNWNERASKGAYSYRTHSKSLFRVFSAPTGCGSPIFRGEALLSPFPLPQPVPALVPSYHSHATSTTPTGSPELCAYRGTHRTACGTIRLPPLTRLAYSCRTQHGRSHASGKRRRHQKTRMF